MDTLLATLESAGRGLPSVPAVGESIARGHPPAAVLRLPSRSYATWSATARTLDRLDPSRVFTNDLLDRLFSNG